MEAEPPIDPVEALNRNAEASGWGLHCAYAVEFVQPRLNEILGLWTAKAAGGLPTRSAFDARSLKNVLPNLSIVECVRQDGRNRFRFRLIGTALARAFGDATGKFFEESVPAQYVPSWTAVYETVLAVDRPVRHLSYFEIPHVSFLDGESFLAPLAGEDGRAASILSVTYLTPRARSHRSA